uniref:sensor histidine kinase n=1 Tax=uncultured Caulobacter sp. TaxID=158749 RepID=UPI0025E39845|nr:HAMP domain-containing sensor histidine kinase [uncultured Caulobacter sp.]
MTAFLALQFVHRAEKTGFALWVCAMSAVLVGWLAAWIVFRSKPPSDEAILRTWIPGAKVIMWLCNLATAASVWVFLPVSDPDLRAMLLVLCAWFLIIQFAAATEATQVLRSAVLLVLGSLTAWLMVERPPYFLQLSLFLVLFGATLIAIRRFVREAVVKAARAQAMADASRRELAQALVELERERDAKTHFIRAASHDLQQPLQAAALFLDGVRPGRAQREQSLSLDNAKRSLGVARSLVEAMLQHLRLEGRALKPKWRRVAAGEIFDRVRLTQASAASAEQIRLSFAGARIALHADLDLLGRAVENLVSNAIRHSGGARVLIGARRKAGQVVLWVIDDGTHFDLEDETRLFLPFEQGSRVGAAGGFGLGLAATRGLAALMGGTCGVKQTASKGAAFYIRLSVEPAVDASKCAA